jgi:hypothetical protein
MAGISGLEDFTEEGILFQRNLALFLMKLDQFRQISSTKALIDEHLESC